MNKIIVISLFYCYVWGFWFYYSRVVVKFVCLLIYLYFIIKYIFSNVFMYGLEYYLNEFGYGGGNDFFICVWGGIVEFSVFMINGKFFCCMYNVLSMEYYGDFVIRYSDYDVVI